MNFPSLLFVVYPSIFTSYLLANLSLLLKQFFMLLWSKTLSKQDCNKVSDKILFKLQSSPAKESLQFSPFSFSSETCANQFFGFAVTKVSSNPKVCSHFTWQLLNYSWTFLLITHIAISFPLVSLWAALKWGIEMEKRRKTWKESLKRDGEKAFIPAVALVCASCAKYTI